MNKKDLIKSELLKQSRHSLSEATKAFETSHGLTTSSELKSEGKYDTRAIESGYLAGAQKARVEQLKSDIEKIENIQTHQNSPRAQIGSLAHLELNEKQQWYFLSPASGGFSLSIEGETIQVISVQSPLGEALVGMQKGESFDLETPKELREYFILEIN